MLNNEAKGIAADLDFYIHTLERNKGQRPEKIVINDKTLTALKTAVTAEIKRNPETADLCGLTPDCKKYKGIALVANA